MSTTSRLEYYKFLPQHTENTHDPVCHLNVHGTHSIHGKSEDETTIKYYHEKPDAKQLLSHENSLYFCDLNKVNEDNYYSTNTFVNYMDSNNGLADHVHSTTLGTCYLGRFLGD